MQVKRTGIVLKPDASRVLFRPFREAGEQGGLRIISRVLSLTEKEVSIVLEEVLSEFGSRHQKIRDHFIEGYERTRYLLPTDHPLSYERKLLVGAYFTHEYSLEAAALFNPSIVLHPDQSDLPEGTIRFILSLRATGEGHISSITFRSGTISNQGSIFIEPPTRFVTLPDNIPNTFYEKVLFQRKLQEIGVAESAVETVLGTLPDHFTIEELLHEIRILRRYAQHRNSEFDRTASRMVNLARSNYEVIYSPEQPLSERVIFPTAPNETNGIEDARFVRFVEEDGIVVYVATYTAYDGRTFLPQLLETKDFLHFRISTLNGPEVQNKGMALFPRRIKGRFAMLSRQDGENLYIMFSDDLHFWHTKEILLKPTFSWEFSKIGNCGSPIETDAGWLVISHGVGPMRKYSIGAFLLDKDNPTHVIGRLSRPLLSADETERDGYVPNVVYTCGAIMHADLLVLPYAMSDSATSFATVPIAELLASMKYV